MGLLDWLRPKSPASQQPSVLLTTAEGQQVSITREQWRDSILPATLNSHRNNPDQLYAVIAGGLQEGFFAEVLDAARHLSEIDPIPSRGTAVYAIALMKTGQLDESQRVLRACMDKHGEDGTLLTNLAKVQAERRDHASARATLCHALEVDPNVENAVVWYSALAHESGGKPAWIDALQQIAALPHNWRAQSLLAAAHLDAGKTDEALELYRKTLEQVPHPVPHDLLMNLTGDLGKRGHHAEAIRLAEPLFSLETHGTMVANNLMLAHTALGDLNGARSILNQLRLQSRLEWKQVTDYWEKRLAAN